MSATPKPRSSRAPWRAKLARRSARSCSMRCGNISRDLRRQVPRALDPKKAESGRGGGDRNRRHLALRRAWNDEHASATGPSSERRGNALSKAAGPAVDQYRQWFTTTVYPRL